MTDTTAIPKPAFITSGPHLSGFRVCLGYNTLAEAQNAHEALAAQPSAGAQSFEISDADLLRAVMDATEEITLATEDDYWRQRTLDSVAKARATPNAPETLDGIRPARILLKHIALYATPAQPDTGDVAALREAIAREIKIWADTQWPKSCRVGSKGWVNGLTNRVLAALSKPNAPGREG